MKKYPVMVLVLILLSGCSGNQEMDFGMELRSRLLQASECTFSVQVCADYGQHLQDFSMDCTADGQGNVFFTVTDPESISGINGKLSSDGGELTFENTALDFGLLAEGLLSPVGAPWILMNALRSGYIVSAGREGDSIRLSIDDSYEADALRLDIWLDDERLPERADVLQEGRRILSLEIESFVIV